VPGPILADSGKLGGDFKMQISDRPTPECHRQVWMNHQAHDLLMTRRGRVVLLLTALFIVAAVAVFGRLYGQHLAYRAMQDRDSAISQLESQSQKLKLDSSNQNAAVTALQTQLAHVQAQLDAIVPSKDVYNINPNQSLLAGDGHLTIGLVGGPMSNGININVNGKQQFVAVGDVIRVNPDPSTSCEVKIQSFDMFKARFTASCSAVKTE
jgi:hypothetical protein